MQTAIPLSLYIHFPWCEKKCPYCDFNSHEVKQDGIPETAYIAALIQDLEQQLPDVWRRRVMSIFIGGGTPSLISANGLDSLLTQIRARIDLSPNAEITMEVNPSSAENEKLEQFRQAGVNRLSIGIQSFQDKFLQRLGRIHSSDMAIAAIEKARQAGFENINIDLMFALPGQTLADSQADIVTALAQQTPHLSYYHLSIEPNTYFYHHPPEQPDSDAAADIHFDGLQTLLKNGFKHYEISALAKHGHQCRHNLNYWLFGDYLGIGAGAHQKITNQQQQQIVRRSKLRHPNDYLQKENKLSTEIILSQQDQIAEFMLNSLRLRTGFEKQIFNERTFVNIDAIEPIIAQAMQLGLLQDTGDKLIPSEHGFRFYNDLASLFV